MNILIVEDDKNIARSLKKNFADQNHNVVILSNGDYILDIIESNNFNIIILDWRLPGKNAYELCKEIRENNIITPIIILTALDNVKNKIEVLDIGADDYITKPFEFAELMARINAITRRTKNSLQKIKFEKFSLNLVSHELEINDEKIKLPEREFDLLNYFLKNRGKIISKDELCRNVWNLSFSPGTNIVEATIKNLRKKLDDYSNLKLIRTIYGEGYLFVE